MSLKGKTILSAAALALTLGLAFGQSAEAVEFKARGVWSMGFGVGDSSLTKDVTTNGAKQKANTNDQFVARQRVLLFLDAVASENLMGSVQFKLGPQDWGRAGQGSALGADGTMVRVTQANMQWMVPQTDLKFKMGLQYLALPNAAGGSAVFDTQAAAVVGSYAFNKNVGLTALWMRPFNDNYQGGNYQNVLSSDKAGYLDNMDLFALTLPLTFGGITVTPWVMPGMMGRNTGKFAAYSNYGLNDGSPATTLSPYLNKLGGGHGLNVTGVTNASKEYGTVFWAGLPIKVTALEPWNIEFDTNYGYVEQMGSVNVMRRNNPNDVVHGSTKREGWLAKALVEYKMDWATPGIFGWYASGDDGNVKNGSERMPSIVPTGNMTSYMGDGNMGWLRQDYGVDYSGTWGIGAQLKDMSFLEDLKHTFRIAYWGGTNSTSMVKYMANAYSWNDATGTQATVPYLTTNDGLVEFNLVNSYKIYQNLEMNLELDYLVNCMDNSTWKKSQTPSSFSKQDMWKAQVVFAYSF